MKFYKLLPVILIVFLKTGNVLSENNIFDVNNIEIEKKINTTNQQLTNKAIQKGFQKLIEKILLEDDKKKLNDLNFSKVKDLVKYYRVENTVDDQKVEKFNYFISFDKNKIHDLFTQRNISYSEITDKEIFILPILKKNEKVYVYNNNFFYDKWNDIFQNELIEFILPFENIEIIQKINLNLDNLINLELKDLFEEYSKKNIVLILIEDNNIKEFKIYLKANISKKKIIKNLVVKNDNLNVEDTYKLIIKEVKKEIINIIKYQNLIDIRVPSFLNAEFNINGKNNLVELNSRLKEIDLVESIYVQKFNNKKVFLKIKYLGKLDKIINQLKDKKIILILRGDQWSIRLI